MTNVQTKTMSTKYGIYPHWDSTHESLHPWTLVDQSTSHVISSHTQILKVIIIYDICTKDDFISIDH